MTRSPGKSPALRGRTRWVGDSFAARLGLLAVAEDAGEADEADTGGDDNDDTDTDEGDGVDEVDTGGLIRGS
jgi:hypothetical protein